MEVAKLTHSILLKLRGLEEDEESGKQFKKKCQLVWRKIEKKYVFLEGK